MDHVANVQLHLVIGSNVKGGEVGVIGPCNTTQSVSRLMVHIIKSLTVQCKLTPKISEFLGRVVGMKLKPQLVYLMMTASFLPWSLPLFSAIHSNIWFSNVA